MGILGAEILELRVPLKPFLHKIWGNARENYLEDVILEEKDLRKLMKYLLLLDIGAAFERDLIRISSFSLWEIYNFLSLLPSLQEAEKRSLFKLFSKNKFRIDPLYPLIKVEKEIILPYNPKSFSRVERIKKIQGKKGKLFGKLKSSEIFWLDGIPKLAMLASIRSPIFSSKYIASVPERAKVKEAENEVKKALKMLGIRFEFTKLPWFKVEGDSPSLKPLSEREGEEVENWAKKLERDYDIPIEKLGQRISELLLHTKMYGQLLTSCSSLLELCYGISFLKGLINREVGWILRDRIFGDLYLIKGRGGKDAIEKILGNEVQFFKEALREGWKFVKRSKKMQGEVLFRNEIIAHSAYLFVILKLSGAKSAELLEDSSKSLKREDEVIFSSYVQFFQECSRIFGKFS